MFNEKFNKFLKRDWLDLNKASYEEFETYAKTILPRQNPIITPGLPNLFKIPAIIP